LSTQWTLLALIVPVLNRVLREHSTELKKKATKILPPPPSKWSPSVFEGIDFNTTPPSLRGRFESLRIDCFNKNIVYVEKVLHDTSMAKREIDESALSAAPPVSPRFRN